MKRLRLMLDEMQWAIARGILEEAGIPFSFLNEQFSSLYPGPSIGPFQREVRVRDEDYETARGLLVDFFADSPEPD